MIYLIKLYEICQCGTILYFQMTSLKTIELDSFFAKPIN